MTVQPIKLDLLGEALRNQASDNGGVPVVQLVTVMDDLRIPVPSIPLWGTAVSTAVPLPAATILPYPDPPTLLTTSNPLPPYP